MFHDVNFAVIVVVINTTAAAIVTVVNAIGIFWGRKQIKDKLEDIHEQTNGGWAAVHQQLSVALDEIVQLKRIAAERDKGA